MDFHESCRLGRIEKTLEEIQKDVTRLEQILDKLLVLVIDEPPLAVTQLIQKNLKNEKLSKFEENHHHTE